MFNICEIDLSFLDDHDPRSASGIQLPVMTEVVRVVNPGMRTSLLTLVLGCCLAFCLFMGLRIIPACQIVLVVNLIHTMDVYHTTSFPWIVYAAVNTVSTELTACSQLTADGKPLPLLV